MLCFGAFLDRLHSCLLNLRFSAEEFFPWVPTVLCDYIKSERWREKARVMRPALMMQHYSETPLSEGFKSLIRDDLRAFKNGVRLDFKVSVYWALEFLT